MESVDILNTTSTTEGSSAQFAQRLAAAAADPSGARGTVRPGAAQGAGIVVARRRTTRHDHLHEHKIGYMG